MSHLIGTSMLRAYMHGYFVDVRLYEQARTLTQPLAFENYKKRKVDVLYFLFCGTIELLDFYV